MNELEGYLAQNRERYTREALTRTLLDAGHDPAAVEAAWARVDAGEGGEGGGDSALAGPIRHWTEGGAAPPQPAGRAGLGTVLLVIVVFLAYGGAILAAGATVFYGGAVSILMVVYVIAMLAGAYYSIRRLFRAPTLGGGASAIGVAFAISVVIFIGLSGACLAALGPAIGASGRLL